MSPSSVTFRPATAGDAAEMVDVHFAAVRSVSPGHYSDAVLEAWSPTPDDQRRAWLASVLAQPDAVCEVAAHPGGAVVGFCLALAGWSRLQALYVHPQHSGLGIGSGLLRAVEARCLAAGVTSIELNASYNAVPFYRANGYAEVCDTTQPLADGTSMGAVLMSKPLLTASCAHAPRSTPGIEIVEHKATWPAEFDQIASALAQALGPLALQIDHIGSTSVAGLCAKDVIDVQVTVRTIDDRIMAAMTRGGYALHAEATSDHVPPGASSDPGQWHKLLFKNALDQRRAHIHVRREGAANQRYALLFRDYLRAHPATAAAYGELKRRLAQSLAQPASYPEVKDPAVDLIYLAAEQWARAVGWQPDPYE